MSKIGKYIALVLRHNPGAADMTLDDAGWGNVSDLLGAIRSRYGAFSRRDLEALVAEDNKQRYSLVGQRIRANQGHSISVNLGLVATIPPDILYHGTKQKWVGDILRDGLIRGKRQHVHLSGDLDTANNVAGRRAGDSVIFQIDCPGMIAAGHSFYQSENGVWLTDHVPPKFIDLYYNDFE